MASKKILPKSKDTLERVDPSKSEQKFLYQEHLIRYLFASQYTKNKIVLDVFLGSGTTMVASHQLKRKCYGMELDPKYCQVIIDRMIKLDDTLEIKINGKEYIKEIE